MKKLITLCVLLGTTVAVADVVQSPIHSVEQVEGTYLIRFENGRVAFSQENPELAVSGEVVEAKVDHKQKLLSIQTLSAQKKMLRALESVDTVEYVVPPVFEPTIIPSLEAATTIFNRLNANYKRESECSNRAHIWSHEEFTKNKIKTEKVFVFFTASYITSHNFKWWFHVAPLLSVQEGDKVEKRVLDYMFNRKPLTIKEWTDQFVFTKRDCQATKKFSEYWVNDQSQNCFLMVGSMYNWMPADFKAQEEQGYYKTNFIPAQVRDAYSEAF